MIPNLHQWTRANRRYSYAAPIAALLCLAGWGATPAAADLTGKPAVIDGNTVEIAGRLIHLFGICAPGARETCGAGLRAWPCGENAGFALSRFIGSNWVACLERRPRADGGIDAVCHAAGPTGPDLNARMVAEGWARAAPGASPAYIALERKARAAGKGIWRIAPASRP